MHGFSRFPFVILLSTLAVIPAVALDIDRHVVSLRTVELPLVDAAALDYASLTVEVGHGAIELGEPALRTTKSICVPKGSKNEIKDAIEVPTHYYDVPFVVEEGVLVVRDGSGKVVFASRIDAIESSETFGHDQCRYWLQPLLEQDFAEKRGRFVDEVRGTARSAFEARARAAVDETLFFRVLEEKVAVYTFRDKKRDYRDLNEAARLAESGFGTLSELASEHGAGMEELRRAIEIWDAALEESQPNEKKARINRKVTAKLYESVGSAKLALDEPAGAVVAYERAQRFSGMSVSRSNGTGTEDLLERARARKERNRRNGVGDERPDGLEALMRATDLHRDRIPVDVYPEAGLARLVEDYNAYTRSTRTEMAEAERVEREAAVADGTVNPYENRVTRTSMQGFVLFLMPFPEKLDSFPVEVCAIDYLNQLRVPNHGFETVPEDIAALEQLEVLDLSGNRITSLPAAIGELRNLRRLNLSGNRITSLPEDLAALESLEVLKLKGNPLDAGEVERLQTLLPNCKIKL